MKRLYVLFLMFLALASGGLAEGVRAEPYQLGVQDRIEIKVFEWQTLEATAREWPALSGEFTVAADGRVSLPLLGPMEASGRTPSELANAISDLVQHKFGLTDRPEASVQVQTYRPFYIYGPVRTPGQHPYTPELSVLQAFSLAGGFPERAEYGTRVSRDLISAAGQIDILLDERSRLLVRKARLEAEENGGELAVPTIVNVSPAEVAAIAADEAAIMKAEREKVERESAALDDLKALLSEEVSGLKGKLDTLDRQIVLAREERDGVNKLKKKGLAINSRMLATERAVADMESSRLDMVTGILRAEQERSKATQAQIGLRTAYAARLATERQRTDAELGNVETKLALQRGLRSEALTFAAASDVDETASVMPAFAIVRRVDGVSRRIEVEADAILQPGDVLEVRTRVSPTQ